MEAQIAELNASLRHGLENLSRRLEDNQVIVRAQHVENVTRLERIETEVRATNGRVTRHDEQLKGHDAQLRGHDEYLKTLERKGTGAPTALGRLPLTLDSARMWLVFATACIGGTWFVMTTVLGYAR